MAQKELLSVTIFSVLIYLDQFQGHPTSKINLRFFNVVYQCWPWPCILLLVSSKQEWWGGRTGKNKLEGLSNNGNGFCKISIPTEKSWRFCCPLVIRLEPNEIIKWYRRHFIPTKSKRAIPVWPLVEFAPTFFKYTPSLANIQPSLPSILSKFELDKLGANLNKGWVRARVGAKPPAFRWKDFLRTYSSCTISNWNGRNQETQQVVHIAGVHKERRKGNWKLRVQKVSSYKSLTSIQTLLPASICHSNLNFLYILTFKPQGDHN